tara:strand:+ start:2624 stop:4759 length:2136 start_codon:yes stop_codon:yes gene_type:complete
MKSSLLFLLLISVGFTIKSQENFDFKLFEKAKKYGAYLEKNLPIYEVEKINPKDKKGLVYIPNNLRSSKYNYTDTWTDLKDTVKAYRVDVIFSKYPLRKGQYKMVHPLLSNRIKNILLFDPSLNEKEVEWRIILQTNCENDEQADSLFHGARIYFSKPKKEKIKNDTTICCQDSVPKRKVIENQFSPAAILNNMNKINTIQPIPDSLKKVLSGKSLDEKEEIYSSYYEEKWRSIPDKNFEEKSNQEKKKTLEKITKFTNKFVPNSKIVSSVMNRHPEWDNALVVVDWTGSMYGHGGQILHWHTLNFKKSGITKFTLFNDGDRKIVKNIGETGGVYHQKANNVEKINALYNLVMSKGGGGDSPENDVEAILKAEMNTDTSQYDMIILLADNNSCVRDISLYDRIQKPVKVILCGYSPLIGIDPDYLIIAAKTGGGVYTIDEDIENLKLQVKGETITEKPIIPLKIKNNRCGFMKYRKAVSKYDDVVFTDIKETKRKKKLIKKINLSNDSIYKFPRELKRMKVLKDLDLSHNKLKSIKGINKNTLLFNLDISNNNILSISKDILELKYLRNLDFSYNKLMTFGAYIQELRSLRKLDISNNEISSMIAFKPMRNLEVLNISNNKIEKLPTEFYLMKKLKKINLSGNEISSINEIVYKMRKVELLDLSNNNLRDIPKNLSKLNKLKLLNLSGNPLPQKVIDDLRKKMPNTRIQFI